MILFSSVVLSFFLALRQLALAGMKKAFPWKSRLLFLLYLSVAALLFFSSDAPFSVSGHPWLLGFFTAFFALGFFFPKKMFPPIFRVGFFSFFVILCVVQCSVSSLPHFYEDTPIARITLTGATKAESVAWKNPSSSLQEASFPCYEVLVETLKGKLISKCFVYGDLVGIRAKVIRLHSFFTFLGIPNLCKMDSLFNDYFTEKKKQSHPHQVFAFHLQTSLWNLFWQKGFWALWKGLFLQNNSSLFVKSATLEAHYFPLVDEQGNALRATYYLSVTAGGLSSLTLAGQ